MNNSSTAPDTGVIDIDDLPLPPLSALHTALQTRVRAEALRVASAGDVYSRGAVLDRFRRSMVTLFVSDPGRMRMEDADADAIKSRAAEVARVLELMVLTEAAKLNEAMQGDKNDS